MKSWVWGIILLATFFLGGWLLGRRTSRPEVVETVRIDTVFYERPHLVSKSDITVNVNVPKFIFAENKPNPDTVTNQETNYVSDSVQMPVIIRTLEYRDSTYYARVVGPVIGSMTPRLDYIETYNKTITNSQIIKDKYKLEIGPAAGILLSDRVGIWVGGELRYNSDRFHVSTSLGFDTYSEKLLLQGSIGLSLYRK